MVSVQRSKRLSLVLLAAAPVTSCTVADLPSSAPDASSAPHASPLSDASPASDASALDSSSAPDGPDDGPRQDEGPDAGENEAQADVEDSGSVAEGDCLPNDTRCADNAVETCGPDGQWGTAVACPSGESCSGGACIAIPSCQDNGPGRSDCGAMGNESCCASLEVPGGTYDRTYVNSGDGGTAESDPATVSAFRLDKYAVTAGRFRPFVSAVLPPDGGAGWMPPAGSGKHVHLNGGQGLVNVGDDPGIAYETGWVASDDSNVAPTTAHLDAAVEATWTPSVGDSETLPINFINWWEAYAFCIWDGGFLPSEAEWEYAAAGGSEQREYAWGSADPGTNNEYAIFGCNYSGITEATTGVCGTATMNIAPVGTTSAGAALWGQFDMAGNVFQWTLDWFAVYIDPCVDCANLTPGTAREARGGRYNGDLLAPTVRGQFTATDRYTSIGVRCARTP
jgi:sulfatase modifying factor 1